MKTHKLYILFFLIHYLFAFEPIIKPNSYSKEGYCIVNTNLQRYTGLLRFKTKNQFLKHCNGKMIFLYEKDNCRDFTMKKMNFDIYIEDKFGKYKFKKGERKKVCGKTIIESIK